VRRVPRQRHPAGSALLLSEQNRAGGARRRPIFDESSWHARCLVNADVSGAAGHIFIDALEIEENRT